jgi:mycothiol system anti-sigma-R factor
MNPIIGSDGSAHTHRCGDLAERIERYLDGELDAVETAQLREHMADCFPCTEEVELRDQIRALVRQECAEPAPVDLVERVRARLDRLIGDDVTRG